jgi:hypothetical protein
VLLLGDACCCVGRAVRARHRSWRGVTAVGPPSLNEAPSNILICSPTNSTGGRRLRARGPGRAPPPRTAVVNDVKVILTPPLYTSLAILYTKYTGELNASASRLACRWSPCGRK